MVISRLREDAGVLADHARRAGWQIRRNHKVLPASGFAFYGDTFTGPALIGRKLIELIEPELDMLARLPDAWSKRRVRFGLLRTLLGTGDAGFYKPADPVTKWFDARPYACEELDELRTTRAAELPALYSEATAWGAEFRAVIHDRQILSLRCYAVNGRRSPTSLQPIEVPADLIRQARRFCEDFLDSSVALPPALVMDVGELRGRGWAIVEFNPLWCSRFYGGITGAYLDALSDIVWPYGEVPDTWGRWAFRTAYTAPAPLAANC